MIAFLLLALCDCRHHVQYRANPLTDNEPLWMCAQCGAYVDDES